MPHMDTLWMDYGSGQNLQVWAIETSGYHDTIVSQYKSDHQVSFPFFSTLTNENILDSFPISYTPWYYVICPDRSLRHLDFEDIRVYVDDCISVPVYEKQKNEEILIYYSNSTLYVEGLFSGNSWNCSLFNMSGQKINSWSINQEGSCNFPISLKSGLYVCNLVSSKGTVFSSKFIVN